MTSSALDLLSTSTTGTLVLLSARVGGLVLIAPVFSTQTTPVAVRTCLVVLLTWLFFPLAVAGGAAAPITPGTVFSEMLVGFALGLGAALILGAMEAMGDLLAVHIGLSGAAALDPLTSQSVPVLGQFCNLFAVALMLSINAHVLMLDAMAASFRLIPVGSPLQVQQGLASMISAGSVLFALGLRFAAPVLVAVLLANVALAIMTRVAPQLQVLSLAYPIQIGLGLFALAATLPLLATFFNGWREFYDGMASEFLGALSAQGGR